MEEDARRLGPQSHSSTFLPSPLRGFLLLLDPSLVPTASHPWSKSHHYLLPRLHRAVMVSLLSAGLACVLCYSSDVFVEGSDLSHQTSQLSLQYSFVMGPEVNSLPLNKIWRHSGPGLCSSPSPSSPFPALKLNMSSFLSELIPSEISAHSSEATFTEEPSLDGPSFPHPLWGSAFTFNPDLQKGYLLTSKDLRWKSLGAPKHPVASRDF